jgi:hypothetical protein
MFPPEGFQTPASTVTPRRIKSAEFKSAFDDDGAIAPAKAAALKSAHPPQFRFPPQDLSRKFASEQKGAPTDMPGPSTKYVPVPPVSIPLAQPKSNNRHSKRTITVPPFQLPTHSRRKDILEKATPLLQHEPPPAPLPSKTTVPLKPIPHPALPVSSPKKDLKSILTTRVARATDPMTDSGHAELLSIFLQDQHHLTSPSNNELTRGVLASPEKGTRSRGSKFLR